MLRLQQMQKQMIMPKCIIIQWKMHNFQYMVFRKVKSIQFSLMNILNVIICHLCETPTLREIYFYF